MQGAASPSPCAVPGLRDVLAVCVCVLAAAVGSDLAGLMAGPLRVAATWLLLISASLLASPSQIAARRGWLAFYLTSILLLIALPLLGLGSWLHELLLVSAVAAWLAASRSGPAHRMLALVSLAVVAWAAMLLAGRALPWTWLASERIGDALGQLAAALASRPVRVGPAFGGVGLLALMGLLYAGWLVAAEGSRGRRALAALVAISSVHLLYLFVLGRAFDLAQWLPVTALPEFQHPYEPPGWRWSAAVGTLLPWNLPLLAAGLHAAMLGLVWRWSTWRFGNPLAEREGYGGRAVLVAMVLLAIALPAAAMLCAGRADLQGKTLLASSEGHVDWERPQHDRYGQASAGMFGMLPQLVRSLGGTLRVSPELSEEELSAADAVLMLQPAASLSRQRCERLLRYVHQGGSLLITAEPHRHEGGFIAGHNQLLQPTSISVRRDVVASETADWQDALQLAAHPLTAGMAGGHSQYFREHGSSLDIRWPARPLILGRWGWSDPGSDALFTGIHRLEQGERMGDLVLAAEQAWGRGKIIVLGNSFSLTNEGGVTGYLLTGRLLHYLARSTSSPQAVWRQLIVLAILAGLCLLLLITARSEPRHLAVVALLLAISAGLSQQLSDYLTRVVPDGRLLSSDGSSRLAYIDASHSEAYSDSHWSFDGINGIALTLMRSGLLTLSMRELTAERLEGAGVFLSIAPARRFSRGEQRLLERFVARGGILICTVGGEESAASNPLLARFGIRVPASPVPTVARQTEPEPLGRIRSLYLEVEREGGPAYQVGARFHAGWPVELLGDGEVLAYGRPQQAVAVLRRIGQGSVIVIGDTGFAMNKNLEYIGGDPFEGGYENCRFWRWLFSSLLEGQAWIPPAAEIEEAAVGDGQEAQP